MNPSPSDVAFSRAGASRRSDSVVVSASRQVKPDKSEHEKLLERARIDFRVVHDYEAPWRPKALEEIDFVDNLKHWSQSQIDERAGRPCLTFDRIGPAVDQVLNDARKNPPEPRIAPVGNGADTKTADILQGLIRNISHDSQADTCFFTGLEYAVKIGRGWWRVGFEYEAGDTFEQKIVIKRIPSWAAVYADPDTQEFDYSDMKYCFVTEDVNQDTFKKDYPECQAANLADFSGTGDNVRDLWFPNGAVRIAEYWWVEIVKDEIAMLPDGSIVKKEDIPSQAVPIMQREVERRVVHGAKITGVDVLDEWVWPGPWIPIVPCIGREVTQRDGRREWRGMVRPAMDANLSYDYMRSKQVEAVGLAPITQWLVAEGQLEGHEQQWSEANRKAHAFLTYKLIDAEGKPAPLPQRVSPSVDISAITIAVAHAENDIKATTATYDASLGQSGPEQSGKAILARQNEGDNAHFHFHDNFARSLRHTGRIIVDLVPKIYSEPRAIRIYDPDGSTREVKINQPIVEQGLERIYNLADSAARYNVTIGTGPSYASKRIEGSSAVIALVQAHPEIMNRAGDLVIKALDTIPNNEEFAARLVPPDVAQKNDAENPIPPQIQAQVEAQQALIKQLTDMLNQATDQNERERMKIDSQERINAQNNEAKLVIKKAELGMSGSSVELQHTINLLKQQLAAAQSDKEAERATAQGEPVAA